jgi:hypothetical protein
MRVSGSMGANLLQLVLTEPRNMNTLARCGSEDFRALVSANHRSCTSVTSILAPDAEKQDRRIVRANSVGRF